MPLLPQPAGAHAEFTTTYAPATGPSSTRRRSVSCHLAVRIAKARGAYVIGTASAPKHNFVRSLGADEVIDCLQTDFATAARDMDVVLDTIGGEYGPRSLATLRPGGILVSIASPAEAYLAEEAEQRGLRAAFTIVEPDNAGPKEIAALIEARRLRVHVETVCCRWRKRGKAHELGDPRVYARASRPRFAGTDVTRRYVAPSDRLRSADVLITERASRSGCGGDRIMPVGGPQVLRLGPPSFE
ncbi:zinc-binding dehydrogenase [Streptomyces sp. NBC_01210]|uniref:zinc-binding dehydrogenase n=1 Tax=Streptomyces sp. NBC_01210 TaxID=2903774 RepID=UPI002E116014|nr:zinc-binding dehydrogenase [Streptomyces sp. NBC_01210]